MICIDGTNADAHYFMAHLCLMDDEIDSAIAYFNKAETLLTDPLTSSLPGQEDKLICTLRDRGFAHQQQGKIEKAILDYERAIKVNPGNPLNPLLSPVYSNYAGLLQQANPLTGNQKVLEFLQKAVELSPSNIQAWMIMANIHLGSEDYESAQDCFFNILKEEPNNAEAIQMLVSTNKNEKLSNRIVKYFRNTPYWPNIRSKLPKPLLN